MLGTAALWAGLAAAIGDVAVPVFARIDLDDSVEEMAESALAGLPDTFFVCGHSLGGIVALEILRRHPNRVRGAVLANTSARAASAEQQDAWARWRDAVAAGKFDTVATDLARANLPASRRGDAGLVAVNEQMARAVGGAGLCRQLQAQATRPESRGGLGTIRAPVVVVSGDEDEVCPPELQRELADCFPAAELVTVAGAGHMLPLENPQSLAEVVRRLVARVRRAGQ